MTGGGRSASDPAEGLVPMPKGRIFACCLLESIALTLCDHAPDNLRIALFITRLDFFSRHTVNRHPDILELEASDNEKGGGIGVTCKEFTEFLTQEILISIHRHPPAAQTTSCVVVAGTDHGNPALAIQRGDAAETDRVRLKSKLMEAAGIVGLVMVVTMKDMAYAHVPCDISDGFHPRPSSRHSGASCDTRMSARWAHRLQPFRKNRRPMTALFRRLSKAPFTGRTSAMQV